MYTCMHNKSKTQSYVGVYACVCVHIYVQRIHTPAESYTSVYMHVYVYIYMTMYTNKHTSHTQVESYERVFASPLHAARRGFIDDIIEPRQTRKRLCQVHMRVYVCMYPKAPSMT
jgi:hypothetical protein